MTVCDHKNLKQTKQKKEERNNLGQSISAQQGEKNSLAKIDRNVMKGRLSQGWNRNIVCFSI